MAAMKLQCLLPILSLGLAQETCYQRVCDTLVFFRDLSYSRALEIVQNEEYLDALDLGDQSVLMASPVADLVPASPQNVAFFQSTNNILGLSLAISLLALFTMIMSIYGNPGGPSPPPSSTMAPMITPSPPPPAPLPVLPNQPLAPFLPSLPPFLTSQFSPLRVANSILGQINLNPPLLVTFRPLVQPREGQVPLDETQPGEAGGGALPLGTTADRILALSCVPRGLKAVSVFPPFSAPRTRRAVAVIFSESDEDSIKAANNNMDEIVFQQVPNGAQRRKSSPGASRKQSLSSKTDAKWGMLNFLSNFKMTPYNTRRRIRQNFGKSAENFDFSDVIVANFNNESNIFNNSEFNNVRSGSGRRIIFRRRIVKRRYGVVVKIRAFVEPCFLGITCDSFGNKLDINGDIVAENVTTNNNGIVVYNPVDLRDLGQLDDRYFVNVNVNSSVSNVNVFRRRQSGEMFASSAPPDCRTEFVC